MGVGIEEVSIRGAGYILGEGIPGGRYNQRLGIQGSRSPVG